MRELVAYLVALALAALVPALASGERAPSVQEVSFPGFPAPFGTVQAPELPLGPKERAFLRSFPGKVALFGGRDARYVVRWVTAPTRRLHPSIDCFRAAGYDVTPEADCAAGVGGCFVAARAGERLHVSETLRDRDGHTFDDVSAWYWAASRGTSRGPWWSVTTVRALLTARQSHPDR